MVRTSLPDQSFSLNLLQTSTDCIAYSPGEWPQAGGFQASTCREPPRQHATGLDTHLTCSIWSTDISLMFQAKKKTTQLVGWCAARKTLGAQEPGGRLCQCLPHCGGLRAGASDHVRSFKEGWVQMLQGLWGNCCHFIHFDPFWSMGMQIFCFLWPGARVAPFS